MRKVYIFILSIFIFSILGYFFPPRAYAIDATVKNIATSGENICVDTGPFTITFSSDIGDFIDGNTYGYAVYDGSLIKILKQSTAVPVTRTIPDPNDPTKTITKEFKEITVNLNTNNLGGIAPLHQWKYVLWKSVSPYPVIPLKQDSFLFQDEFTMYPKDACTYGLPVLQAYSPIMAGSNINIIVRNINPDQLYEVWIVDGQEFLFGKKFSDTTNPVRWDIIQDDANLSPDLKTKTGWSAQINAILTDNDKFGTKRLCLKHDTGKKNCEVEIPIEVTRSGVKREDQELISSSDTGGDLDDYTQPDAAPVPDAPLPCGKPFVGGVCPSVRTAIGDLPTNPAEFVRSIFSIVLGLSGGIALILIMVAGYKTMTSGGNPEATKAATEGLTSAVVGLLFIIFAFVILQIIGVDILKIPGFSK